MVMSSNFIRAKKEGTFCLSSTFKLMAVVVEGGSKEDRCDLDEECFAPRAVNCSASSCFAPTEAELPTGWRRRGSSDDSNCSEEAPIGGTNVWSRVPSTLQDSTARVTDSTVFVRVRPILTSIDNHVAYVLEPCQDVEGCDPDCDCDQPQTSFWETRDLVSSRLLPFVNGQRTVAQVASFASVDPNIARLCMTQLALLGVIRAVSAPVFLHPTVLSGTSPVEIFSIPGYVGLPRLLRLLVDEKLRNACFESVMLHNAPQDWIELPILLVEVPTSLFQLSASTKRERLHITDPEGLILKILQVFSKLCGSPYLNLSFLLTSTQSFVNLILPPPLSYHDIRSSSSLLLPGISLVRLVQFGEANSLIHRLRCYPISAATLSPPPSQVGGEKHSTTNMETRLWNLLRHQMMDGVQSVDDLVYEASAWAIKSQTSTVVRNSSSLLSASEPSPVLNTCLSDAVVAFTSKLLKEKEDELTKGRNPGGFILTEMNSSSEGSKTSLDHGINGTSFLERKTKYFTLNRSCTKNSVSIDGLKPGYFDLFDYSSKDTVRTSTLSAQSPLYLLAYIDPNFPALVAPSNNSLEGYNAINDDQRDLSRMNILEGAAVRAEAFSVTEAAILQINPLGDTTGQLKGKSSPQGDSIENVEVQEQTALSECIY
ncbi:hypothetical protein ACTXT7_011621 [Hymenolepis weldensis]